MMRPAPLPSLVDEPSRYKFQGHRRESPALAGNMLSARKLANAWALMALGASKARLYRESSTGHFKSCPDTSNFWRMFLKV